MSCLCFSVTDLLGPISQCSQGHEKAHDHASQVRTALPALLMTSVRLGEKSAGSALKSVSHSWSPAVSPRLSDQPEHGARTALGQHSTEPPLWVVAEANANMAGSNTPPAPPGKTSRFEIERAPRLEHLTCFTPGLLALGARELPSCACRCAERLTRLFFFFWGREDRMPLPRPLKRGR